MKVWERVVLRVSPASARRVGEAVGAREVICRWVVERTRVCLSLEGEGQARRRRAAERFSVCEAKGLEMEERVPSRERRRVGWEGSGVESAAS